MKQGGMKQGGMKKGEIEQGGREGAKVKRKSTDFSPGPTLHYPNLLNPTLPDLTLPYATFQNPANTRPS